VKDVEVPRCRSLRLSGRRLIGLGTPLLGALLLLLASATAARSQEPIRPELWRSRAGDDLRWARPGFDDSAWRRVPFPATWQEQGYRGVGGTIWFRRSVALDEEARLAARAGHLGILLGPPDFGGYQVYAGGRLVGTARGWSLAAPHGVAEVFPVPREAVGKNGEVSLALRVRRATWITDSHPDAGAAGKTLILGSYPALRDQLELKGFRTLWADLPVLILSYLFLAGAFYHLLHLTRRRQERGHLWFGLLSLAFTANTLASSYWIYTVIDRYDVAKRISDLSGHAVAALAIQFLWTFLGRPIGRLLRAYQLSHVALALFIAFWPSFRPVVVSEDFRNLWLLPLLPVVAVLILRAAWQGQAEARTLATGALLMVAVEAVDVTAQLLGASWTSRFSLAPFGFAVVLVAMDVSLSRRFRRVHGELDRLRLNLEEQVRERTAALVSAKDEALAASRVKSQFLANMSHEIRTPMNAVLGMAALLAETPLTPTQRAYAETIRTSGDALLALINDVLDFSKMESDKVEIERAPFRLAAVIEQGLEMVAPLSARQGIALRHSIAPGTPEALIGDHARTRQVLVNLLGNAVKFTLAGEVRVALSARTLPDGRIETHFAVSDTGIGIAPEDLGRLFVAFQQLDGSLARKHSGTGLGLAISKRLTELMGGTIWAESTPGQGSTFHFTIVGEAAPPPSRQPAPTVDRELAKRRPLRVLLAEDHLFNQQVILALLEHLGYRADLAGNGREVLEALAHQDYDVILMDVQMPEIDGLETTRRIRRELAADRQPRIIALTAHAMTGDRESCLAAGMDGFLSKPVKLADLHAALAASVPLRTRETVSGADSGSPLELQTLGTLRALQPANGEDVLGKLVSLFLSSSSQDLADVRQLARDGRWSELGRAAHRLKGSSGAVGAIRVQEICAAIEEQARGERPQDLGPLLAWLEVELERARAALEMVAAR
jgi:signal transduction histidine kinase/HPt (histidine-containing phosphotransfer) domain-containing protein/ActR/RegA family two-component response regulator